MYQITGKTQSLLNETDFKLWKMWEQITVSSVYSVLEFCATLSAGPTLVTKYFSLPWMGDPITQPAPSLQTQQFNPLVDYITQYLRPPIEYFKPRNHWYCSNWCHKMLKVQLRNRKKTFHVKHIVNLHYNYNMNPYFP